MKLLSKILLLLLVTLGACNSGEKTQQTEQQAQSPTTAKPRIKLLQEKVDFGTITEGENIYLFLNIVNLGPGVLYINRVETSCGCTLAQTPEKRIKPGDTAVIQVIFNSAGYKGYQLKEVTVYSNAQDSVVTFKISGFVK